MERARLRGRQRYGLEMAKKALLRIGSRKNLATEYFILLEQQEMKAMSGLVTRDH